MDEIEAATAYNSVDPDFPATWKDHGKGNRTTSVITIMILYCKLENGNSLVFKRKKKKKSSSSECKPIKLLNSPKGKQT